MHGRNVVDNNFSHEYNRICTTDGLATVCHVAPASGGFSTDPPMFSRPPMLRHSVCGELCGNWEDSHISLTEGVVGR